MIRKCCKNDNCNHPILELDPRHILRRPPREIYKKKVILGDKKMSDSELILRYTEQIKNAKMYCPQCGRIAEVYNGLTTMFTPIFKETFEYKKKESK